MFFKYFVCVVALTTLVLAYDFKDADFNEYLFDELQADYAEQAGSLRLRRDVESAAPASGGQKECGKKDWNKDYHCCAGEKIDQEQVESFKEIKKQCHVEVRGNNSDDAFDPFDCQKMQLAKEQMVCVSECVAKKFNIIDEQGEFKRETILTMMRSKIGDTQWKKDGLEIFVDKCLAEAKTKKAEHVAETAANGSGCSRCPLEFHHCIWREFANGCPADLRVDSPKCAKIRERLAKGDTSFLNKHFLHRLHHDRHEE